MYRYVVASSKGVLGRHLVLVWTRIARGDVRYKCVVGSREENLARLKAVIEFAGIVAWDTRKTNPRGVDIFGHFQTSIRHYFIDWDNLNFSWSVIDTVCVHWEDLQKLMGHVLFAFYVATKTWDLKVFINYLLNINTNFFRLTFGLINTFSSQRGWKSLSLTPV